MNNTKWTLLAIALMVSFCAFGGSFLLNSDIWYVNVLIGYIGGFMAKSIIGIKD